MKERLFNNNRMSDEIEQSRESIRSTIRKLETAEQTMTAKSAGTTLLRRRLDALLTALAALDDFPEDLAPDYSSDRLKAAEAVLTGLIPSLERQLGKARPGSPQTTLIRRRITALTRALEIIAERILMIQTTKEQTP